ncbi:hypothetical protein ROZALSC1DRAFT_24406 [Rozella allomycis CSF55]|uniref:Uncharacterized protein n=1 Tax=Rozella allomycis (strain CSF55) TaxID=988480 RepID=A0A4P9YE98_ROZAC|nr:hypothetical protein ROZALSC1DRAFT_24406 [Rozella allomycis CSF55]
MKNNQWNPCGNILDIDTEVETNDNNVNIYDNDLEQNLDGLYNLDTPQTKNLNHKYFGSGIAVTKSRVANISYCKMCSECMRNYKITVISQFWFWLYIAVAPLKQGKCLMLLVESAGCYNLTHNAIKRFNATLKILIFAESKSILTNKATPTGIEDDQVYDKLKITLHELMDRGERKTSPSRLLRNMAKSALKLQTKVTATSIPHLSNVMRQAFMTSIRTGLCYH